MRIAALCLFAGLALSGCKWELGPDGRKGEGERGTKLYYDRVPQSGTPDGR